MNQPQEWALAHAAGEQPRNEMSVERKMLKALWHWKWPSLCTPSETSVWIFPCQSVKDKEFTSTNTRNTQSKHPGTLGVWACQMHTVGARWRVGRVCPQCITFLHHSDPEQVIWSSGTLLWSCTISRTAKLSIDLQGWCTKCHKLSHLLVVNLLMYEFVGVTDLQQILLPFCMRQSCNTSPVWGHSGNKKSCDRGRLKWVAWQKRGVCDMMWQRMGRG